MLHGKNNITLVSYINTWPFLYGIENYAPATAIFKIDLAYPSKCSERIISKQTAAGLLPVGALLHADSENCHIITPYCIGANNNVYTVTLFSNIPVEQVETIFLDYQSTTSVLLTKVIFEKFYQKKIQYLPSTPNTATSELPKNSAQLLIGDRCFEAYKRYKYSLDLSAEWHKHTQLPFAFAVWVSTTNLSQKELNVLDSALTFGLKHIGEAIKSYNKTSLTHSEIVDYLTNNIQYDLTEKRTAAIRLFLEYAKEIKLKTL